jgi:hypothetical protein
LFLDIQIIIKRLKEQQASENDQELENNQDKDSSEQSQDPQSEE